MSRLSPLLIFVIVASLLVSCIEERGEERVGEGAILPPEINVTSEMPAYIREFLDVPMEIKGGFKARYRVSGRERSGWEEISISGVEKYKGENLIKVTKVIHVDSEEFTQIRYLYENGLPRYVTLHPKKKSGKEMEVEVIYDQKAGLNRIKMLYDGKERGIVVNTSVPVTDTYSLLLSLGKLNITSFKIDSLEPGMPQGGFLKIDLIGEEMVSVPAGNFTCLVFSVRNSYIGGMGKIYLRKERPRFLVKYTYSRAGSSVVIELEDYELER